MLVLSLFPGIDLLGRGFEDNGFCVVRGPDKLWGGDIRAFTPPANVFAGIIGGSPCQDFSGANRSPGDYGYEMLDEYVRVVKAARPQWWLLENVPAVPDVVIAGYSWQRLDLRASEFGLKQRRIRHFQFGHRDGKVLSVPREQTVSPSEPCVLASTNGGRRWETFCELQGLPSDFDVTAFSKTTAIRVVGQGVPLPMARALAKGINNLLPADARVCVCGCGRPVTGRKTHALARCRKRMQLRRLQSQDHA